MTQTVTLADGRTLYVPDEVVAELVANHGSSGSEAAPSLYDQGNEPGDSGGETDDAPTEEAAAETDTANELLDALRPECTQAVDVDPNKVLVLNFPGVGKFVLISGLAKETDDGGGF